MILLKPMNPIHLEAVHEIERACFITPWSKETILTEITSNSTTVYIVALVLQSFSPPEVAGYAGMWQLADEGHVTNLAVKESRRRQGIATMLLNHLTKLAIDRNLCGLTLEVRVTNTAAQDLYIQQGYVIEGRRKGYYADTGEDAFIMWKRIR